MIKSSDLYTYETTGNLKNAKGTVFGSTAIRYVFDRYQDVRNLDNRVAYLITCRQRIIIPNATPYQPGPSSITAFSNYPALMSNGIEIGTDEKATLFLKSIFPRTLNASISSSSSVQAGSTTSTTNQYTSGSSQSQTNSFGVSVSGGFFMNQPTFNVEGSNQHSVTNDLSNSISRGNESGRQNSHSEGDTMTIKDWSSYGFTDAGNKSATWIWGQTYPWDVIAFHQSGGGSTINLPSFVKSRLMDGNLLLPPSHLSLFGVDFTMMATWLLILPEDVSAPETVTFTHRTTSYLASHTTSSGQVSASLYSSTEAPTSTYVSPPLDLSTYALEPITHPGPQNGAAIGFAANPFTYAPKDGGAFKIISPANNVQVTGSGFNPGLTTSFAKPVSLRVDFKILDSTQEYALLLMHWIKDPKIGPCKLTLTVNEKFTNAYYVDSAEGQGGQNNVTAVELRNTSFTSINFHDYLVLGVNRIDVQITPENPKTPNSYTLFALAIGQA